MVASAYHAHGTGPAFVLAMPPRAVGMFGVKPTGVYSIPAHAGGALENPKTDRRRGHDTPHSDGPPLGRRARAPEAMSSVLKYLTNTELCHCLRSLFGGIIHPPDRA